MKEKIRIIVIAGSVLVALIAVALLVPERALERRDTGLSAEQIEDQEAVIIESEEALKDFEARGETDRAVYYNEYIILAGAYERIGDLRKARQAYEGALEYAEEPQAVIVTLYEMEVEFENYDRAREVLIDATEDYAGNFAYWDYLIALEKNHFDLAGEALGVRIQESIEATDRALGSLVTHAFFLEDEGEYEEALEYWREAAALRPGGVIDLEVVRVEALLAAQGTEPAAETPAE